MALTTFNNRKRVYYVILFACVFVTVWILSRKIPEEKLDQLPDWEPPPLQFPLHRNASNTLFDLHLHYLQRPEPCPSSIQTVIIVTSHQNNVEVRSAMRRTISQTELEVLKMKRFFLLGEAKESDITKSSIEHESTRFQDIIQGNFMEAYRNLTYKHVMGLKWVSDNCPKAKYVIKMDDDIVFNVQEIVHFMNNTKLPQNSISGYVLKDMKVIREPANKWYVTQQEYQYSKYPSFVSGWFYITTPEIASKLVLLSHYFKYFWIDDVYVTGILAKTSRIRHYDLRKYFTVHSEFLQCCMADVKKQLKCEILIGPNGGDNNLFYEFNKLMKICDSGRCSERVKPINETCVAERKINIGRGSGIIENYKLH